MWFYNKNTGLKPLLLLLFFSLNTNGFSQYKSVLIYSDSVGYNIVKSDIPLCNNSLITVDTVPNTGLHYGSMAIYPDGIIYYVSSQNASGIDSVDFIVSCESESVTARMYLVPFKPLSSQYFACEKAVINVGVEEFEDTEYFWYNSNGDLVAGNTASVEVTKNALPVQTLFVEVHFRGEVVSPRFGIDLILGADCGTTGDGTACDGDKRVLFIEDFGGNDINDVRVSSTELPQGTTDYAFSDINQKEIKNGTYYSILKYNINQFGQVTSNPGLWHTDFSDFTHPGDTDKGYMMLVEAGRNPTKIYERTITNLCNDTRLYFSARISNLGKHIPYIIGLNDDPMVKFELFDQDDNLLVTFNTGKIPRDSENQFKWRLYGFYYTIADGITSVRLKISNNYSSGYLRNALVMDNIEISICVPPVTISSGGEFCNGSDFNLNVKFDDTEGVFGKGELYYQWWFKPLNGNNWVIFDEGITYNPVDMNKSIQNINEENEGYYMFGVGNETVINKTGCISVSDSVLLQLKHGSMISDVRVMLCPVPERQIMLKRYIDTVNVTDIIWKKKSALSPEAIGADGICNSRDIVQGVHTYRYTVKNECGEQSANFFIKSIVTENMLKLPPDTVSVCYEKAGQVQVNSIIGIEANGTIELEQSSAADNSYISINSNGGIIYNGKKAFEFLGTNGIYKGENVRITNFKYIQAEESCIEAKERILTLILSPVI